MTPQQIVAEFEPAVRRWFAARVVSHEDAEDLCHDALIAAINARGRFDGRASFRTWIYAICRNTLSNYRRRLRLREHLTLDENRTTAPERPDDETLRIATRIVLASAPARLRELYNLRFRRELSVAEIATRIGRSEGTIKYQLHELRRYVARRLGEPAVSCARATGRR